MVHQCCFEVKLSVKGFGVIDGWIDVFGFNGRAEPDRAPSVYMHNNGNGFHAKSVANMKLRNLRIIHDSLSTGLLAYLR